MPSDPAPDALFRCEALHCMLRQRVCVRRQVLAELDILGGAPTTRRCRRRADPNRDRALARHDGKRGLRDSDFAPCFRCVQGQAIRRELGDQCAASVRHGGVSDVEALRGWAAERRMLAILGEPPTLDTPPMPR